MTAKKHNLPVDCVSGDDVRKFPIEVARSRGCYILNILSVGALTSYGWVIHRHVHQSVPLIFQLFVGAKCTIVLQLFSTLIFDIFPENHGSAAAANDIMRCLLSAALVAVKQKFDESIGKGWMFTLIGLVGALSSIMAVWMLRRNGRMWRMKREKTT
ncbi:hypothetical protein P171DRAFT_425759 [Karstenula rhodostoma CBS 690.94]|uniref:Uncharacterized protein n=1 Tax=Karstenula rhodostoma CBS 690.94 TaxID=1392251 RepID=A0A9P4PVZ3_9PLEO|nr:hypothetical protein P171DRAFT_425759 [Karstenula rhodostoma CBS 690.94]